LTYIFFVLSTDKKTRLTSAERMRAYRQRLREKQMTKLNTICIEVPQDDFGNNSSEPLCMRPSISTDSSMISKYLISF